VSENKELNEGTNREVNGKQGIREAMNIFNSRLYYKVAISSWKKYNSGGLQ